MREIKFKAWDKSHDCMIPANELVFHEYTDVEDHFSNEDLIFLQYTGLKDKKGESIFEGDILQHPDRTKFTVKWENSYSGFRAVYKEDRSSNLLAIQINDRGLAVVMGNIYENSELLDVK